MSSKGILAHACRGIPITWSRITSYTAIIRCAEGRAISSSVSEMEMSRSAAIISCVDRSGNVFTDILLGFSVRRFFNPYMSI